MTCPLKLSPQHPSARARRLGRWAMPLMPALLAACSTAPLSFIEGVPFTRVDPTLEPVQVVAIDGRLEGGHQASVGPGPRTVVLAAPPSRGMRLGTSKAFAVNVEPCTRYRVAARRSSPMSADWKLVVEGKEPVGGCDPAEEWRKTGQSAPAPAAAPPKAQEPVEVPASAPTAPAA